eukprot:3363139-Amphidinium_carterae.1
MDFTFDRSLGHYGGSLATRLLSFGVAQVRTVAGRFRPFGGGVCSQTNSQLRMVALVRNDNLGG